jgi:hypothetical protein
MPLPADHADLLKRTGFPVPDGDFTAQEREILSKYGHWMQALAGGDITPLTPEQERFILAARGEADPASAFDVAWAKLRRAAERPASGPLELSALFDYLRAARREAAAARTEHEARRAALLEQIRPQLDALDAELADRLETAASEAARVEAEVRAAILAQGASFKHAGIQATFYRGRVSWDNKGLAEYMRDHPEIEAYRKVGQPTVSLRFEEKD